MYGSGKKGIIRGAFEVLLCCALAAGCAFPTFAQAPEQTSESTGAVQETFAPSEAETDDTAGQETQAAADASEPKPTESEDFLHLASEAAVLMDAETGQVLYSKNLHKRMYPASITKVMTGMLALQTLNPQDSVTVSYAAVRAVPGSSSHISLNPGEVLTVEQAMYALALESANDAANVLAEAVSGDLISFAERMTAEAQNLGAVHTRFANANGLPDSEHYTTAYDMALITSAALKTPGFTDYFSAPGYDCASTNQYRLSRTFTNRNQMISGDYRYEGLLMSKTGWTSAAQGTLVTAVRRGETILVAVVLKSLMTESKYQDTWKLMDYGFDRFAQTPVAAETVVAGLDLADFVPAEEQQLVYLLPVDSDVSEVVFALADGTDITSVSENTIAVTVTAALGDMQLPDRELMLERVIPETEPETVAVIATEAAEPEPEAQPEGTPVRQFAMVGAGVILFFAAILIFRRQRSHARRRRRLESRIRRMKKQMEQ